MSRKAVRFTVLLGFALGGCGATYRPPVDVSQPGFSQARYDADLSNCRGQASSLSLSRQQAASLQSFGSGGNPNGNPAITYYRGMPDQGLMYQAEGIEEFLNLCMMRKGYRLIG